MFVGRRACCIALVLAACSAGNDAGQTSGESPLVIGFVSDTMIGTAHSVWATVETPFEDVGIIEDPIPDKLQKTVSNPYAMPNPLRCNLLRQEIAELDALLGPDVCTTSNPTGAPTTDYWQQGAGMARDQAVGFVDDKIGLPFRGLVRHVSGADRHAKDVERAYQNGRLRRAFLKGVGLSLLPGCLTIEPPTQKTSPARLRKPDQKG